MNGLSPYMLLKDTPRVSLLSTGGPRPPIASRGDRSESMVYYGVGQRGKRMAEDIAVATDSGRSVREESPAIPGCCIKLCEVRRMGGPLRLPAGRLIDNGRGAEASPQDDE